MPGPLSNAHTITKLPAQDLERARAFYRDKLGLEVSENHRSGRSRPPRPSGRPSECRRL